MISRLWHAYALPRNADKFERLLLEQVLPGIHRIDGYQGGYMLRRDLGSEVEFIVITQWESLDAIRAFAGDEESAAVVPDAACALLHRWDEEAVHYRGVWSA